MTSDRVYRNALSPKEAINELKFYMGKYYDESIVLALEQVLKDDGILLK